MSRPRQLLAFSLFLALAAQAGAETLEGKVVGVRDGDDDLVGMVTLQEALPEQSRKAYHKLLRFRELRLARKEPKLGGPAQEAVKAITEAGGYKFLPYVQS